MANGSRAFCVTVQAFATLHTGGGGVIDWKMLEAVKELGKGSFGTVMLCRWKADATQKARTQRPAHAAPSDRPVGGTAQPAGCAHGTTQSGRRGARR